MVFLYNEILHNPLLGALIFFYNTIAFQDLGVAIVFLTILIRLVLFPVFQKSAKHQMQMQEIQPHVKKVQDDHKHDKEKQMAEMMALYKKHKVNPFTGFLLLLVQLPVLIALYRMFINVSGTDFLSGLYGFISRPEELNIVFLGLINLGERSIFMVGIAALAQYFQAKLALVKRRAGDKRELTQAEKMGRKMVFVGPALTLLIFYNFPAAVSLYWASASIFSVFQQLLINKQMRPKNNEQFGRNN